jgi:hypothetical protein
MVGVGVIVGVGVGVAGGSTMTYRVFALGDTIASYCACVTLIILAIVTAPLTPVTFDATAPISTGVIDTAPVLPITDCTGDVTESCCAVTFLVTSSAPDVSTMTNKSSSVTLSAAGNSEIFTSAGIKPLYYSSINGSEFSVYKIMPSWVTINGVTPL